MSFFSKRNPEAEQDLEMLRKHATQLSEHFGSVRIFVSKVLPDGGSRSCTTGKGDWYAQYGAVSLWASEQTYEDAPADES